MFLLLICLYQGSRPKPGGWTGSSLSCRHPHLGPSPVGCMLLTGVMCSVRLLLPPFHAITAPEVYCRQLSPALLLPALASFTPRSLSSSWLSFILWFCGDSWVCRLLLCTFFHSILPALGFFCYNWNPSSLNAAVVTN